jgi:YHS domain-containing protein
MKKIMLTLFLATCTITSLLAQKPDIFVKDGAAIRGYDPVAYFVSGKPVIGSKEFSVDYMGARWYFSSKQNADAFKADPAKYAPQYGGYCAYGLAGGHKASTEPDAWTIVDGKLYLNYNKEVQAMWSKDQKGYIMKADKNWPAVKNKQ